MTNNDCFLESIPGLVNCTSSSGNEQDGVISISDNTSSSDGSLDLTLTDAVPVSDESYSLDDADTMTPNRVGFIIAKEDLRNKLVLFNTFEESDYKIVFVPLNSGLKIPKDVDCIIYDELSETDENYKYIKAYFPKIYNILPRGTYVSRFAIRSTKSIGKNVITSITEKFKSNLTIKTSSVWGTEINNKYLDTAFRRSDYGIREGIAIKLKEFQSTETKVKVLSPNGYDDIDATINDGNNENIPIKVSTI